ncbi:Gastric triacylglycerol lipase, partial [Armadillidium vulgare]
YIYIYIDRNNRIVRLQERNSSCYYRRRLHFAAPQDSLWYQRYVYKKTSCCVPPTLLGMFFSLTGSWINLIEHFGWGEMALYDATAAIDYALNITGNTEVYYVGFSMGTTIFFALMSEKPMYAAKIKAAALMAPVAYVENIKGPLRLLANYSSDLDEYLPIYLSHTPAGTSIHTVNHYAQLVLKGVFQMYDWGPIGNEKHYGQEEPPMYKLQVDTPPIALYWGQNDWLADPTRFHQLLHSRKKLVGLCWSPSHVGVWDNEEADREAKLESSLRRHCLAYFTAHLRLGHLPARLSSELKNVVVNQRVEHDQWNHMDFVWGIHAKEYVYEYLIDFFSKY